VEALSVLIKHGADVQHTNNLALLVACRNEWPTSPKIVDLLLSHGANAYDRQGKIIIRMRTATDESEEAPFRGQSESVHAHVPGAGGHLGGAGRDEITRRLFASCDVIGDG